MSISPCRSLVCFGFLVVINGLVPERGRTTLVDEVSSRDPGCTKDVAIVARRVDISTPVTDGFRATRVSMAIDWHIGLASRFCLRSYIF